MANVAAVMLFLETIPHTATKRAICLVALKRVRLIFVLVLKSILIEQFVLMDLIRKELLVWIAFLKAVIQIFIMCFRLMQMETLLFLWAKVHMKPAK